MNNNLSKAEKSDHMKILELSFLILHGFFDYCYGSAPQPQMLKRNIFLKIFKNSFTEKKIWYSNSLFPITFHVGKKISLLHYISWHCMSFFSCEFDLRFYVMCVHYISQEKNPFVGLKNLKSKYRCFQCYEIHLDESLDFLDKFSSQPSSRSPSN